MVPRRLNRQTRASPRSTAGRARRPIDRRTRSLVASLDWRVRPSLARSTGGRAHRSIDELIARSLARPDAHVASLDWQTYTSLDWQTDALARLAGRARRSIDWGRRAPRRLTGRTRLVVARSIDGRAAHRVIGGRAHRRSPDRPADTLFARAID
ncbi:uncharacterized protein SCHCODRAFT_02516273 [Schizophyllum commune H4-8]|nr:uncharacterized protein SCHCODRAFT_02516273 [Schizophyllum commune H4-8]KAI5886767.1 hypothetical protein SCHCODRAFT_02516273 [Schizophyllum commune H4-8]